MPVTGARVLVDRELYVPRSWTGDRDRCAAAGIGEDIEVATKPALAWRVIERAVGPGLPFGWFTAGEAYGDNGELRDWLEENSIPFVVAVSRDHRVPAGTGRTIRADAAAAKVPDERWQGMSCGPGTKGKRLYDWAIADAGGVGHYLLIRRSPSSGELAYYRCWSSAGAKRAGFVQVAAGKMGRLGRRKKPENGK